MSDKRIQNIEVRARAHVSWALALEKRVEALEAKNPAWQAFQKGWAAAYEYEFSVPKTGDNPLTDPCRIAFERAWGSE